MLDSDLGKIRLNTDLGYKFYWNFFCDFQEVLPSGLGGGDVAASSLKSFQKMMTDYATLTHAEDVQVWIQWGSE